MRNAYKQVLAVRVNMSVQVEFVSRNKVTAVSSALNDETRQRFLLHPNIHGSFTVFEDVLEIASLIAPRALVVEAAAAPESAGPPPVRTGRSGGEVGEKALI